MVTSTGRTTTVYVIGKCPAKGCRNASRVVVPDAPIRQSGPHTYTDWQIPAAAPYGTVVAGLSPGSDTHQGWGTNPRPSRWLANNRHAYDAVWFAAVEAAGWICTAHDRFMVTREVRGVVNAEKPCTATCRGATGPSCECVCGGQFHGSNHG
jgi:hypothetical protein